MRALSQTGRLPKPARAARFQVVMFSGRARGQPTRETLDNPCAENFILFQIG